MDLDTRKLLENARDLINMAQLDPDLLDEEIKNLIEAVDYIDKALA